MLGWMVLGCRSGRMSVVVGIIAAVIVIVRGVGMVGHAE